MKVDDLKTLSDKLLEKIEEVNVEQLYHQFLRILTNSLKNNREQSVSKEKEKLFNSLLSFDQLPLTYSEANLLTILGYKEYIGSNAVAEIETILYDENFDPQGVIQKIESKQNTFKQFVAMIRNLKTALQNVPTLKDVALNEGEALLEITFSDQAAIDNIVDFEGWIDSWTKILRAFSELVGEKPESARIIFVQKSSPMILDVATACGLVLMIGKAVDCVLGKVEKYLNIRKQVEEIKKLKLENKKIAKDLESEANKFSETSSQQIAEKLISGMATKPDGAVVNGISLSIKKLFGFIDKGGRVDCPSISNKDEELSDIFEEVRQLQKDVDKLRLLPEPSNANKKRLRTNKFSHPKKPGG